MAHGSVFRKTSPSFPIIPAVPVPSTTLAGAMELPKAPPALCAPMIVDSLRASTAPTDSICSGANKILEAVLLEVINAPSTPIQYDKNAKTDGDVISAKHRAKTAE